MQISPKIPLWIGVIVVVSLAFAILGTFPSSSNSLSPFTGRASFKLPVFTDAFSQMGKEGGICRLNHPVCDAGLACDNGVCRKGISVAGAIKGINEPTDFKIPKESEPLIQGAPRGFLGAPCRREQPFCNAGLVCEQNQCIFQRPQIFPAATEPPAGKDIPFSISPSAEQLLRDRAKDEAKRKAFCREEYRVFRRTGQTDRKCHAECFLFNITDTDCCTEQYCPIFKRDLWLNTEMLETQCRAQNILLSCPFSVPPAISLCNAENPEALLEEGQEAFVYDFDEDDENEAGRNEDGGEAGDGEDGGGSRHIDVCFDEDTVKHVQCFQDSVSEELTRCPAELTCSGGLCGGEEVPVCFDSDVEDDVFVYGQARYLDYFPENDYCGRRSYTRVEQVQCFPQEEIVCSGWDCQFAFHTPGFCRNSFCHIGACRRPSEYDLNLPNNEFPRDSLSFSCEDADGLDPTQGGGAEVVISYLGRELERTKHQRDYCSTRSVGESFCTDRSSVEEAYCARNELGQPITATQTIECPEGTLCFNGACQPINVEDAMCTEVDGGDNPEVFSDIQVQAGDFFESTADRCKQSSSRCTEYFCDGLDICVRNYNLPENAVANEEPWESQEAIDVLRIDAEDAAIPQYGQCIDIDLGDHPTYGSYARARENGVIVTHTDNCIDDNTLREMTCADGQLREEIHQCAFGCKNVVGQAEAVPDGEEGEEPEVQEVSRWQGDFCLVCQVDADCGEGRWCDQNNNQCRAGGRILPRERLGFENYPLFFFGERDEMLVTMVISSRAPASDVVATIDIAVGLNNFWCSLPQNRGQCGRGGVPAAASVFDINAENWEDVERNVIVIGGICENTYFGRAFGDIRDACEEEGAEALYAEIGSDNNHAFLFLENLGRAAFLGITSPSAACRREAGRVLMNYEENANILQGDELRLECP